MSMSARCRLTRRVAAAATQWPAQPKELSAAPPPWADRRDTLNYSLELVSSSPQEAARRFSMTLSVDTQEVGIVEQPNIELVRTLRSLVCSLHSQLPKLTQILTTSRDDMMRAV